LKGVSGVFQKRAFLGQKCKFVKTMTCVPGNLVRKWRHEKEDNLAHVSGLLGVAGSTLYAALA
jgi:hypothetical protein